MYALLGLFDIRHSYWVCCQYVHLSSLQSVASNWQNSGMGIVASYLNQLNDCEIRRVNCLNNNRLEKSPERKKRIKIKKTHSPKDRAQANGMLTSISIIYLEVSKKKPWCCAWSTTPIALFISISIPIRQQIGQFSLLRDSLIHYLFSLRVRKCFGVCVGVAFVRLNRFRCCGRKALFFLTIW